MLLLRTGLWYVRMRWNYGETPTCTDRTYGVIASS
jgi:hypothetical protein